MKKPTISDYTRQLILGDMGIMAANEELSYICEFIRETGRLSFLPGYHDDKYDIAVSKMLIQDTDLILKNAIKYAKLRMKLEKQKNQDRYIPVPW